MAQTREYETLYILAPNLEESEQQTLIDALAGIVTKNEGEVIKNDVWGRRRLAFPIEKNADGFYVLLRFKGVPSIPDALDTFVKRNPLVLRHLTTVVTVQQLKEEARLRAVEAKRAETAKKAAEEAEKRKLEEEAKAAEEAAAAAAEAEAAPETEEAPAAEAAPEEAPAVEAAPEEAPAAEAAPEATAGE